MTQKAEQYKVFRAKACGDDNSELFEALSELDKRSVGADGWSAESFRSEAEKENGYVLYITENDRVVALLTAYYAVGEGDITSVAVAEDYRRRGLAQRLIAELEELLPEDAEEIFLEVRESNAPATGLYEKCGFENLSVRKNFYDNPRENAVVMRKKLK